MHIPLIIAILAFLALALLPVLDRSAISRSMPRTYGPTSSVSRTLDEEVSHVKPGLSCARSSRCDRGRKTHTAFWTSVPAKWANDA